MRVAIVCKTFLKGGAEKQALTLAKLLHSHGIEILLLNLHGDKIDKKFEAFIKDNSLDYIGLRHSVFSKIIQFQKVIRDRKINVVLSYLTLANFFSGVTRIFNRDIVTVGGIRNEKLPYPKFLMEKLIHNTLNDITVFNNFSAREKFIGRGFNPGKIRVIQNAIEINNVQVDGKPARNGSAGRNEIKIVTVARFVRQKDYGTALKSFSELRERVSDINLVYYIIGYGELEKEIRLMIRKLNLEGNVKIFINPVNVRDILCDCDIFLSTSIFEGVSNSIMEAMVTNLPVVATDVGDNKYLVKDGINGFLVGVRDTRAIVRRLEELSLSEEKRLEFGRNSLEIIKKEFSRPVLLEKYVALLESFDKRSRTQSS